MGRIQQVSKVRLERTSGKCGGTGTRRYTDAERGIGMGMQKALAPGLSRTIDTLIGECGASVRRAKTVVRAQLKE